MPSKQDVIDERKANLPLPDDPPAQSDWQSADARTVNVVGQAAHDAHGAGSEGLREPATGSSSVRVDSETLKTNTAGDDVGRQAKDGLAGIPNDAVTRDKKDNARLAQTTGQDYGYPEKSDPSSGLK